MYLPSKDHMDRLRQLLQALLLCKIPFALYRLSGADEPVRLLVSEREQVKHLASYEELTQAQGFVLAPFKNNSDCPLVVLAPSYEAQGWDEILVLLEQLKDSFPEFNQAWAQVCAAAPVGAGVGAVAPDGAGAGGSPRQVAEGCYQEDFELFSQALKRGEFSKLVLSSYFDFEAGAFLALDNFIRACQVKPLLNVSLMAAPGAGAWFVATPESLLRQGKEPGSFNTMALAGTRVFDETRTDLVYWSQKDQDEQGFVSTYIREILNDFAAEIKSTGPYSARAGGIMHLRTDFDFTLKQKERLGELIGALHPTPAVCGLPKKEAYDFICAHEHSQRAYYAGFFGELNLRGSTQLLVNLRTLQLMRLEPDGAVAFRVYAGGGLLEASVFASEYQEIKTKAANILANVTTGELK